MPFTPEIKNPGDLVKSKDWNEALQAIVTLFTKFDQATGHLHSGAPEDAPPIGTAGIADNAIATSKIQNNAITAAQIADGTIGTVQLASGAVTADKIADATITAAKIAAGVVPRDIGIAIAPNLQSGQTISPPTGYAVSECVFFAFAKTFSVPPDGGSFSCFADTAGNISASAPAGGSITVVGIAIAKRGGWS